MRSYIHIVMIVCTAMLSACEQNSFRKIVPISGALHAPEGKFKFRTLSRRQFDTYFPYEDLKTNGKAIIMAETDKGVRVFFSIGALRSGGNFFVSSMNPDVLLKIKSKEFKYTSGPIINTYKNARLTEADGSDKELKVWKSLNPRKKVGYRTRTTLPCRVSIEDPDALRYDHHMHVAFEIDGTPYVADFTFRVRKGRRMDLKMGMAGTP